MTIRFPACIQKKDHGLSESGLKCWRKSSIRLGLRYRRPYCARHTSVSWNLMSSKNPLRVSAQHGHSLTTMFRTYAAWVRGATEADVAMIQSAMNRKKSAGDCTCSQEARSAKGPVARLGTRLATGLQASKAQLTEILAKLKWRRGWDCSRPGTAARPPLRSGPPRLRRDVQKSLRDFCRTRLVRPHILHRQLKRAWRQALFNWRRGWDSNPRAGITRPSDFESAPL